MEIAYFGTLVLFSKPPKLRVSAIKCEVIQVAGSRVIVVPDKLNCYRSFEEKLGPTS